LGTALLLSSIGDVLLDLDPGLFVIGLGAFLTAHVLYTVIFFRNRARPVALSGARIALLVLVLGYAALFARWLIPGLGALAAPVALYICAITAMVLTAILARFPSHLVVLGAFLFLVSDSVLAVDRFKTAVPMRGFLVWTTYYLAQYSIARGVLGASKPLPMTNREIRAWYLGRTADIARLNQEWIAQGVSLEERALRAWRIRHDARALARSMMENPLEIDDLRQRDLRLYGNPDGPAFDQLVQAHHQRGLTPDETYERIIRGSQATIRDVNKLLDLSEG
jgi:uncharacterized membrane protein YhhN